MAPRPRRWLIYAFAITAVVALCGWASLRVWGEAYGAGPPYYGRTTNMDKWQDPSAQLVWLNGIGLALIAGLALALRRSRRRPV